MTTTQPMQRAHSACELFPMVGDDEFAALKEDIRTNGQREPIVLVGGELVDGRNRLRACEALGIEPKVRNLTAKEAGDVFALVMSLNFHRRHLKPHEQGRVIEAFEARRESEGAERKRGGPTKGGELSRGGTVSIRSTAKILGVPKSTVHRAVKAAKDYKAAAPALRAKVDAGELTPKQAARQTAKAEKREAVTTTSEPAEHTEATLDGFVHRAKEDATQRFACIYADPPWRYGNQGTRAATDDHYGTMSVDEICALPIADIAAEDAHLHLWTTNAFLFDAKRVMEAWGFEYKSCFVWVKPQMGIGNYWRVSHEFLLFGMRGDCPFGRRDQMSWAELPRGRHSAKPDAIRQRIEKVSPGPRIELFARDVTDGWSAWGNQLRRNLFTRGKS